MPENSKLKKLSDEFLEPPFTYDAGDFEKFVRVDPDQRRKDLLHIVRHLIAIIFIGVYLLIMVKCYIFSSESVCDLPDAYLALVSAIIGFYFGSSRSST